MITVTTPDIDPTDGRPCAVRFADSRYGRLDVHIDLSDRSLWIFGIGPSGGERGKVATDPRHAEAVLAWMDNGGIGFMPATFGNLSIDARNEVRIGSPGARKGLTLQFDPPALGQLRECLARWASSFIGSEVLQ